MFLRWFALVLASASVLGSRTVSPRHATLPTLAEEQPPQEVAQDYERRGVPEEDLVDHAAGVLNQEAAEKLAPEAFEAAQKVSPEATEAAPEGSRRRRTATPGRR